MKLSKILAGFHTEINSSVPYVAAHATRLQVSTPKVTSIQNGLIDYNLKYGIYANPATHTEQSVTDIHASYDLFHPEMQALKKTLKHNKDITLVGADYSNIHIHQDAARRSHIPAPTTSPINMVTNQTHLVVYIFTHEADSTANTERALPVDTEKIGRKLAVVPVGSAAPTAADYVHLDDVGTSNYHLVFEPTQEGMKGHLITWYKNPRGESGPPSAPLSFTIT